MSRIDDDFWRQKALEARHTQLDRVRKSAAGWTALFTAVLGAFGAVTFAGGLTGLDEMSDGWRFLVRLGIAVAAALAVVATVLTGLAGNAFPTVTSDTTLQSYRDNAKKDAERARGQLVVGLRFAAVAAVVVVTGSLVVLFVGKDTPDKNPPTVVAVLDGTAVCGKLDIRGSTLMIGSAALENVTSLTIVDACPE